MTAVSSEKLTNDMRSHAQELVNSVGLVPQAEDRPLEAGDLLFYISETSMPMADFLRQHGLFMDANGLNFDLTQFIAIRRLANSVIDERQAGDVNGVWKQHRSFHGRGCGLQRHLCADRIVCLGVALRAPRLETGAKLVRLSMMGNPLVNSVKERLDSPAAGDSDRNRRCAEVFGQRSYRRTPLTYRTGAIMPTTF